MTITERAEFTYSKSSSYRNTRLVRDLVQLPKKTAGKVLHHPVITSFIQRRWRETKWSFQIQ